MSKGKSDLGGNIVPPDQKGKDKGEPKKRWTSPGGFIHVELGL